ncbi:MAG: AraC family transcriptional regulator, partial [Clostridia bacterium]
YQSMRQTLSYVRALPLYEAKKTGYLVVNVPIARLAKQAGGSRNPAYDACAVFVGDTWLYHDGQELAKHAKNAALTPMQALDAFRGSYPCYAVSSAPERLVSVRYYQAWFKLLLNLFPPLSFMLLCCMGGLLLVLILSLLLSRLMLAPVNALLVQLGATSEGATSEAEELLDGNEFDMLALAFERLNDQLQHSQRTMRNNQPLLRERMITSLLYAPMDLKAHQKELQSCGIEFPYPYFAVVLLSPPQGATYDERTHIALRRTVESVLQELGKVYSTYGESNTTLFLINAQEYENLDTRLEQALRGLQASIAGTLAIRPSFSVGLCAKDEPNLCNAAMRARQNVLLLGAKACAAPEELVTLLGASEYAPAISPQTINTLCTCIVNADQSGAKHLLHEISETYFPASIPLQHARKLSTALCCHVFLTLTEMDLPPAYEQFAQLLKRLEQETDVPRCEALAQSWVHTLLGSRKNLSSESTAYVSKAIDYIEQHYMQRISVPEIAQTACVNPVYLNRLFKQATDKTISEYLNFYRVEQSIPLLLQSDTLVEISAAVGFNEPRGYIRFFKKFYDVTPSEYRRQKSAAQGETHKL